MATFTDITGRGWSLRVTAADLPRLRAAGFDVWKVGRGDVSTSPALDDPEMFVRVLWTLCEAQAGGVTPEQFGGSIDGPTYHAATGALEDAVADFTQPPEVATALKARLPAVREERTAKVVSLIRSTSTASAGSSPASPASTPAPAPSAS